MIRLTDAVVLAYTKLRVHKIRNGLAVGIAGILFGLLAAVIVVSQGAFDSITRFGSEGLGNRTLVVLSRFGNGDGSFNVYDHLDDQVFIQDVEATYKQRIATKQTAAKRYNVPFNAPVDDPSPITTDPASKQKHINEGAATQLDVQAVTKARMLASYKSFDPHDDLKPYKTAKVVQSLQQVMPRDGALAYMVDDKEDIEGAARNNYGQQQPPTMQILDGTLTEPFITNHSFDPSKGEIPVVVPYSLAEKTLGYKPFAKNATTQEKYDRLRAIRQKAGEVTISFCYRNKASQSLLTQAIAQQKEIDKNAGNKDYVKPSLIYKVPDAASCGPVVVASDTRTSLEKRADSNMVEYQKTIGEYDGDPIEQKIIARGVGISGDPLGVAQLSSTEGLIDGLLGSSLGYGNVISVPSDLLQRVPTSAHPQAIFGSDTSVESLLQSGFFMPELYLVEFGNKAEARDLLARYGTSQGGSIVTMATPFGNSILLVDDLKDRAAVVLTWIFLAIGGVAMIILAGVIGRAVADGRRESAVFRAIGASRLDIGAIYGGYTILLCWRILVFSAVLGGGLAVTADLLFSSGMTLGARFAYASPDTTKEFHLVSLNSPYLLWIVGTIFAAGILASIIPILLGARRNPINDMRNDT